MTAFRWILLCLVAFGVGTGAALAVSPPESGLPPTTASALAEDLDAIARYAPAGRCDAVRGRIDGAQAKLAGLPNDTPIDTVNELQRSLRQISRQARAACDQVAAAKADAAQKRREAQEAAEEALQQTTPTTPIEPTEPTTPDPGSEDGGPDPGTGEDPNGGVTTPDPGAQPPTGGITPEDIQGAQEKLEKKLEKERRKWEKRVREMQEAWGQ